ncbi:MAG: hypothetical protein KatS3mg044_0972 [Rhodothermaceae bacterium]|nr:MAG: hypothetical protein KatS3mg044_0972 [Rhodothermaceae bacterium]
MNRLIEVRSDLAMPLSPGLLKFPFQGIPAPPSPFPLSLADERLNLKGEEDEDWDDLDDEDEDWDDLDEEDEDWDDLDDEDEDWDDDDEDWDEDEEDEDWDDLDDEDDITLEARFRRTLIFDDPPRIPRRYREDDIPTRPRKDKPQRARGRAHSIDDIDDDLDDD